MADRIQSNGTAQWVRADRLSIDPEYQRDRVESTIRSVREAPDHDALGALYVSKRADGSMVLLDGQQRWTGIMEAGYGDQQIQCIVYVGLSVKEEAALFVKYNRDRTAPRPMVIHNAAVVSGDATAVALKQIVEARGLKLAEGKVQGNVQSVSTVRAVYENAGATCLKRALDTIVRAWGATPDALQADFIRSLGVIYSRYGRACDENRMARQLSKEVPGILLKLARVEHAERGGATQTDGRVAGTLARLLLRLYNKGLTQAKRLEWDPNRNSQSWWSNGGAS